MCIHCAHITTDLAALLTKQVDCRDSLCPDDRYVLVPDSGIDGWMAPSCRDAAIQATGSRSGMASGQAMQLIYNHTAQRHTTDYTNVRSTHVKKPGVGLTPLTATPVPAQWLKRVLGLHDDASRSV